MLNTLRREWKNFLRVALCLVLFPFSAYQLYWATKGTVAFGSRTHARWFTYDDVSILFVAGVVLWVVNLIFCAGLLYKAVRDMSDRSI